MSQTEFFKKVYELSAREEPFVVATVVKTEGSSSARAGAKAIIVEDGRTIFGWVGGGCAESTVLEESLAAFKDGNTRMVHLDLQDEILGVGMPCGGTMEVYVEPFLPRPPLVIVGHGRIAEMLASLGTQMGFSVTVDDPLATEEKFPSADRLIREDADLSALPVQPRSFVVIATQHRSDDVALRRALDGKAGYIALVASRKRTKIVFDTLIGQGVSQEQLESVRAPAGLDIGARTPEEIALSILSQIVLVRRGGTGESMGELKETKLAPPRKVEGVESAPPSCD
ncbi:MAG: XdhC family protein [Planctomycetota bacterium]|nr:XdhC family protein [Planctomycetota bacterium]